MNKLTSFLFATTISLCMTLSTFAQNGTTPVYLDVLFDNSFSSTSGISSDGGLYSHGYDSVTAQFTDNGYLNFISGTRPITAKYPTKESPGTGDGTASLAGKSDTKLIFRF